MDSIPTTIWYFIYLEIPEPNSVVFYREREHMIYKGFALGMITRSTKNLHKKQREK